MRLYQPKLGRFVSPDPLIVYAQAYSWYSSFQFAGNVPIAFTDLDGLEPKVAGKYEGQIEIAPYVHEKDHEYHGCPTDYNGYVGGTPHYLEWYWDADYNDWTRFYGSSTITDEAGVNFSVRIRAADRYARNLLLNTVEGVMYGNITEHSDTAKGFSMLPGAFKREGKQFLMYSTFIPRVVSAQTPNFDYSLFPAGGGLVDFKIGGSITFSMSFMPNGFGETASYVNLEAGPEIGYSKGLDFKLSITYFVREPFDWKNAVAGNYQSVGVNAGRFSMGYKGNVDYEFNQSTGRMQMNVGGKSSTYSIGIGKGFVLSIIFGRSIRLN